MTTATNEIRTVRFAVRGTACLRECQETVEAIRKLGALAPLRQYGSARHARLAFHAQWRYDHRPKQWRLVFEAVEYRERRIGDAPCEVEAAILALQPLVIGMARLQVWEDDVERAVHLGRTGPMRLTFKDGKSERFDHVALAEEMLARIGSERALTSAEIQDADGKALPLIVAQAPKLWARPVGERHDPLRAKALYED